MAHSERLQQLQGYRSAGLGIREGVVVVDEVIAAGGGDGLQRRCRPFPCAGSPERALPRQPRHIARIR